MSRYDEGYCLVLSGGGAKGAYHLGVWKALLELDIPITAIVGSSIGAALGAAFATGDPHIWETTEEMFSIEHVLNLPESFTKDGKLKVTAGEFRDFRDVLHTIIKRRGLDTTPFKDMINTWISEDTIRANGIDLGINTLNLSTRRPEEIFLEDIPPGKLNAYILASASFPGFEQAKIDGQKYIDGGIHDSIPYQMARKRGYSKIILSDISGVGNKHRINTVGTQTVYVKNTSSYGGVLDFDKETIRKLKFFGYADTLKVFGEIEGASYYFRKDMGRDPLVNEEELTGYLPEVCGTFGLDAAGGVSRMRRDAESLDIRIPMLYSEYAAMILGIERERLYTYEDLYAEIGRHQAKEDARICEHLGTCDPEHRSERTKSIEQIVKVGIDASLQKETPYYLLEMVSHLLGSVAKKAAISVLLHRYPELPGGLLVIRTLQNRLSLSNER